MKLTEQDIQSKLWIKLEKYFDQRLAECRIKNDVSKPDLQTEKLRGRIAEIKHMKTLGDLPPMPSAEETNDD